MSKRFQSPDSFYSHGWLVPFACAWLIWQRRDHLRSLPRESSFWGISLLLPSLVVYILSTRFEIGFTAGFAMIGILGGIIWTLGGGRLLWGLRFPILFLLFMVPLPSILMISASFKMKMAAAGLATHVIRFLGVSAQQAGSTINVPGASVIVDDTCSGLRSLISLMALATLWTSFMGPQTPMRRKWAVVAASLPIAVVSNTVRIVILVLLAAIYGSQVAEGFIHYWSGIVVFGVAVVALLWISSRVQRWPALGVHPT